jgi:hypothetical protein
VARGRHCRPKGGGEGIELGLIGQANQSFARMQARRQYEAIAFRSGDGQ